MTLRPRRAVLARPAFETRTASEKVDARNYSQWFSSRLIFDNTPLKDIIINLERRYNIEISLSSNISPEKRLSLVVCHEPLEDLYGGNVLFDIDPLHRRQPRPDPRDKPCNIDGLSRNLPQQEAPYAFI